VRIRRDRNVVFGHRVRLLTDGFEITLSPIRRRGGTLETPFTVVQPDGRQHGVLEIDPEMTGVLPLIEDRADVPGTKGVAWAMAIVGLYELSCVEYVVSEPARRNAAQVDAKHLPMPTPQPVPVRS